MHIPDGFLDLPQAGLLVVAAAILLGIAAKRAEGSLERGAGPLVGVMAAGIFAAQMLNWPLPGGTSAHFVGGALVAILLGPHLGALAMASVVTIQAIVFGDGGVLALGANVFNMAIVDVYVGYVVYRLLADRNRAVAVFAAGWLGITAAALAAAVQLGLSSAFAYDVGTVVTIMGVGHLLLGLIEGAITLLVYRAVASSRPDVLEWGLDRGVGV